LFSRLFRRFRWGLWVSPVVVKTEKKKSSHGRNTEKKWSLAEKRKSSPRKKHGKEMVTDGKEEE